MNAVKWHVSSSRNRASIEEFGLDWTRMGAARGIAGSTSPEADGIFLGFDLLDAHYFSRMNNTGGTVDVWAVEGVDAEELRDNGSGYQFVPRPIARADVDLRYVDVTVSWPGEGAFTIADVEASFEPFRHHADPRAARRRQRAARAHGRR